MEILESSGDFTPRRPSARRRAGLIGSSDTPDASRAAPIRVLLIEDHVDVREMYAGYLNYVGMHVLTAADGLDGVDKAHLHRPDVIVMDLGLPLLDGLAATRRLRADPRTSTIPIIALTAFVFTARKSARDAGCDAFLPKPCLPEELANHIRTLFEKRRF